MTRPVTMRQNEINIVVRACLVLGEIPFWEQILRLGFGRAIRIRLALAVCRAEAAGWPIWAIGAISWASTVTYRYLPPAKN